MLSVWTSNEHSECLLPRACGTLSVQCETERHTYGWLGWAGWLAGWQREHYRTATRLLRRRDDNDDDDAVRRQRKRPRRRSNDGCFNNNDVGDSVTLYTLSDGMRAIVVVVFSLLQIERLRVVLT